MLLKRGTGSGERGTEVWERVVSGNLHKNPKWPVRIKNPVRSQAAQTHVAREGCNVIYITYVTRTGVALQATVENIRDFVWEIYH